MRTTFSVGDMTIHRIVEQEKAFTPVLEFLPGLSKEVLEENRSWMEPAALDPVTGNIVLCFQSYVVKTPHHTVLIDSCIGNDKIRPARAAWNKKNDSSYMQALAAAGVTVEDIDFVMCTHLHVDHVGWNTKLENGRWVPTFPNARYLFSQREYEYWANENEKNPIECIVDSVLPIVAAKKANLVRNDHALGDHFRLIPTPGHTIDHFAVALGRGGRDAVITGDLIHSPLQARYPELSMRVDYDAKQAATTRRNFLASYCDTSTLCCTAHFPSPSVGHIKRWGEGFRCEPVTG
jgi:glyoxylase-like metal-dependent hydrolase (beta-lactamase superfamily II)